MKLWMWTASLLGMTRLAVRSDFKIDGGVYSLMLIAARPAPDAETGETGSWQYLLQLDAGTIDLFKLPLVGSALKSVAEAARQASGSGQTGTEARLDKLAFILATSANAADIALLFDRLDSGRFPSPGPLAGRATVRTDIKLLDYKTTLVYPPLPDPAQKDRQVVAKETTKETAKETAKPLKPVKPDDPAAGRPAFAPPAGKDRGWWLSLDCAIGPVTIDRVGVATDAGMVSFLVDASGKFGPLRLSLLGLEVTSKVKLPLEPQFDMKGLVVGAATDTVAISGGLMKIGENRYAGSLMIGFGKVSLTAIGTYCEIPETAVVDGKEVVVGSVPSLAVFAVLGIPLGGPPAFYVTGLAGGIGYNRRWSPVALAEIGSHPLVVAAEKGGADAGAISQFDVISPPRKDEHWIAVGVKFTSFKIINGVGVLVLSAGAEPRLSLLAKADLTFPPKVPGADVRTLAHAEILLKAEYLPSSGELKVDGMLAPKSFLLDKSAEISGGFALYCWFDPSKHAGDFVLTLGGYHPRFKVPAHYPKVARLALNWKVCEGVTIKGEQYFALTPAAVMAGGLLEVSCRGGWGTATFRASADFIIYFQPFSYSARIAVAVHVDATIDALLLTIRVSLDLQVALNVWGPPFGALATVKFYGLSKDISIGERQRQPLLPVEWSDFRASFLPLANADERARKVPVISAQPTVTDSLITIAALTGLLGSLDPASGRVRRPDEKPCPDDDWLVDPGALKLAVNTTVPSKVARLGGQTRSGSAAFGIGPMRIDAEHLTVETDLTVPSPEDWALGETVGAVPVGLWRPPTAELPDETTIAGVLTGTVLDLRTRAVNPFNDTKKIPQPETSRHAGWARPSAATVTEDPGMAGLRRTLADPAVAERRDAVLAALRAVDDDVVARLGERCLSGLTTVAPQRTVFAAPERLADFAACAESNLIEAPQLSTWEAA